jgi:hypothetical protein
MQTPMPWVGFEPMNPVFGQAKIVHGLDRMATFVQMLKAYSRTSNNFEISLFFLINHFFLSLCTENMKNDWPCKGLKTWSYQTVPSLCGTPKIGITYINACRHLHILCFPSKNHAKSASWDIIYDWKRTTNMKEKPSLVKNWHLHQGLRE